MIAFATGRASNAIYVEDLREKFLYNDSLDDVQCKQIISVCALGMYAPVNVYKTLVKATERLGKSIPRHL